MMRHEGTKARRHLGKDPSCPRACVPSCLSHGCLSPRGFTLVELMIGMIVTALVTGAAAALLSAVAQGWKQSGESSNSSNIVMQTPMRLQTVIGAATRLAAC